MKQIYLLYGDDSFSIEAFEKKFASENVDPEWETFNLDILDGSSVSVDKIVESADSPPFGTGNKVTVVKNAAAAFSQKEDQLEPLDRLLNKDLMPTNFLIFSTDSADKRKNIVKTLVKVAEVKEFNLLKPWEIAKKLYPWVEDSLRKHGKRIEQEALEELVEASGANKHRLENEIGKLLLYTGENKIITFQDVRTLVENTESDLFEFLGHLARKETGNALRQLNKLLLKDVPIKLVSSLSANFKTIYSLKVLAEDDMNNSDIARELGQKPFLVEKNLKTWRNFKTGKLREIMKDLLELDFKFKSRSVNAKQELEAFIVKNFR
jgi:DNA polymerase-3 subunit delta